VCSLFRYRYELYRACLSILLTSLILCTSCSNVPVETIEATDSSNSTPVSSCSTAPVVIEEPCSDNATAGKAIPVYTYRIINSYPHDNEAFTQGLVYEDGFLYEGTGLREHSTLRKVELESGNVVKIYDLPEEYFGEGITIYDNKIIQLTWKSKEGFVYDKDSFKLINRFTYPTEGWGLTHNGHQLIMSDGTSNLYFLDPETFTETNRIQVTDGNRQIEMLNELEYINGEIFANIWRTDSIARISPESGDVTGWIDLKGLLKAEDRAQKVDVLNGITYDSINDRLFVTGKLWPKLFEISIIDTANFTCSYCYSS